MLTRSIKDNALSLDHVRSTNFLRDLTSNEYINGIISNKQFLDKIHTVVINELRQKIKNICNCYLSSTDLAIYFDNLNMARPDLCMYEKKPYIEDNITRDMPKVIFEIITIDDCEEFMSKYSLYETYGINEYWILDFVEQKISVIDNINKALINYNLQSDLYSLAYDKLKFNLRDIYHRLIKEDLIEEKPEEEQFGLYVKPGDKFDPWIWLNSED